MKSSQPTPPPLPSSRLRRWRDNLLFIAFCLALAALLGSTVWKREPSPASVSAPVPDGPDFQASVRALDDAFSKNWEESGVTPVSKADELTVMRRLSLALTGTIPSLQEIRAFHDQPENFRLNWWVSYLLQDRRSADYLAERFARAYVGVENGPFIVFRRRRMVTWLSDQIYRNRPYDDLVHSMIAAEGIWTTEPEANFITATIDQNNNEEGPDQIKLAARVTRAFLGVRIDCMQCHDDKFGDRWKQQDFHQLAAFFAEAEMSLTGVRDNEKNVHQIRYRGEREEEKVPPQAPFQPELLPDDGPLRDRLATWVTHPGNRAFARATVNRTWAILFGRPLVEPIDNISLEGPWPAGMEVLADDLIRHDFDLHRLIRVIAASRVFQLGSRTENPEELEKIWASFPVTRLRPEQVAQSVIQASSLRTIDANAHIIQRLARFGQTNDFLKRYGDPGEAEFAEQAGTIPQRLLLMNGKLVHEKTEENIVMNASTRISALAPDDRKAVKIAYLTVLTRNPTEIERTHFESQLQGKKRQARHRAMQDLFWSLMNATEFSWNH